MNNLEKLVFPYLEKLKNTRTESIKKAYLGNLESNLKEIAELLNLSPATVDTHRQNIRKKLALTNKKMNLRTILTATRNKNSVLPEASFIKTESNKLQVRMPLELNYKCFSIVSFHCSSPFLGAFITPYEEKRLLV